MTWNNMDYSPSMRILYLYADGNWCLLFGKMKIRCEQLICYRQLGRRRIAIPFEIRRTPYYLEPIWIAPFFNQMFGCELYFARSQTSVSFALFSEWLEIRNIFSIWKCTTKLKITLKRTWKKVLFFNLNLIFYFFNLNTIF